MKFAAAAAALGCLALLGAVLLLAPLWFPKGHETAPVAITPATEGDTKPFENKGPETKADPPPLMAVLRLLPIGAVTLAAGQSQKVTVRVQRENCPGPIELKLENLPVGVQAKPTFIAGDSDTGTIELVDSGTLGAKRRLRLLAVAGSAKATGELMLTIVRPVLPKTPPLASAPFSQQQAKEHQKQWAEYLESPVEITNFVGMKLALVPAGKFTMGSPVGEANRLADEGPEHEVEITKPFYLGVYEVTQEEYGKLMSTNPSAFKGTKNPVERVSWDDAVEFCRRLSELGEEKKSGRTYRLPTEAEWEYACRGGGTTVFHVGDSLSSTQANFKGAYPYGGAAKGKYLARPTSVGSYPANAFGLYDMHGNVWEWCADWYGPYNPQTQKDPQGPQTGERRVLRGGSWYMSGGFCRAAVRFWYVPADRFNDRGFRVACVAAPRTNTEKGERTEDEDDR